MSYGLRSRRARVQISSGAPLFQRFRSLFQSQEVSTRLRETGESWQRGWLLTLFGILILLACSREAAAQEARRPNILVIVADDLGYSDLGPYGSVDIPTPNIDRLAAESIRFTDGYVSGPYCSPTRAGLLTGKYPQRFGHEFNLYAEHDAFGLPLSETTIADRLWTAGYRTGVIGKWHLGVGASYHPQRRGFEDFFGFLDGGHQYLKSATNTALLEGVTPVEPTGYLTDTFTNRAVDYITAHASEPWFLYLAYNAAHVPLQATKKYLSRVSSITDSKRRTYAAMVSALDDGVGRVLETVRTLGLDRNTLVIFLNDNGGPTLPTNVNGSNNLPLRGAKRTTWEGGIRVPFMMRWTGRWTGGRVETRPIIQLDVLPTALAAAGEPFTPGAFDGVNLLPFLDGMTGRPHDTLYWRLGDMMAIRQGDWKLVKTYIGTEVALDDGSLSDLVGAKLYHLASDPYETTNRASSEPARVLALGDAWRAWHAEMIAPLWH